MSGVVWLAYREWVYDATLMENKRMNRRCKKFGLTA